MVKLVRNKTIEDYEHQKKELIERNEELIELEKRMREQNEGMKQAIAELEAKLDAFGDENSVTLRVSDDLTRVIPSVRVKREVFEKMVELGYLDDTVTSESKPFAMQLALMHVCSEALEQIMESFAASIES